MSVAAAATPRRPTRGRLVLVALALSLALNFFFVAGAAWTRMHPGGFSDNPAERLRQMAGQLDLDPQQRVAFERYFRTMRARTQLMREEIEPLIGDAWSDIAKPQPDEAQVMRLFDQAAEKRRAFQREATTQTMAFLAGLTPEQRAKFVEIARQRHAGWAAQPIHRGITP